MNRQQLLALLAQNELDQVVEIFKKVSPNLSKSLRNQITLAIAQYNGYLDDKHGGQVSQDHLDITLNRLRAAMNHNIGQIPDNIFPIEGVSSTNDNFTPAPTAPTPSTPSTPTVKSGNPALGIGALLAAVGVLLGLIFFRDELNASTGALGEMLFLALLSILIGVVFFQFLPSKASVSGKKLGFDVKLGGAITVAALVAVGGFYFLEKRGVNNGPFDFTVRLLPQQLPNYPSPEDGNLKVWVLNRYEKPELNSDLLAEVKGIPASEHNKRSDATLERVKFWKLEIDSVTLTRTSQTLKIVPDGSLGILSGRVKNEANDKPLAGVNVEVAGGSIMTDEFGKFYFEIPVDKQKTTYSLIAVREGYAPISIEVHPGSQLIPLRMQKLNNQ